eukprot:Selendium_serpulae@DN6166_c0_g1_i4.p1
MDEGQTKVVDVLILGGQSAGKTQLLKKAFEVFEDNEAMTKIEADIDADKKTASDTTMNHYRLHITGYEQPFSILVVSGSDDVLIKHASEWYPKARRVIIVYNVSDTGGESRVNRLIEIAANNESAILFGNTLDHTTYQKPIEVSSG